MARYALLLFGLAWGGFGLLGLFAPDAILGAAGISFDASAGITEARTMYGGSQLGLALFFFWAAGRPAYHVPGLVVGGLYMGGAALARAFGVFVVGATDFTSVSAMVMEFGATGIALISLWQLGVFAGGSGFAGRGEGS
ncbi:MAG: DUF4345 family protein [Myxococcota bacterium]